MHSHLIKDLLNLEGVIVKKVSHSDEDVVIMLETKAKPQICPACGAKTGRIHDYRMQYVKDLPLQEKRCFLGLRKRRYICSCGKRFLEKYPFLARYQQRTVRLTAYIAAELHSLQSVQAVAERTNISSATVNRILDTISFDRSSLGNALSIDEFKGNADRQKFQCILTDPRKHKILDILPSRESAHLSQYFKQIPRQERLKVQYFSCDMCRPYTDLAKAYFPAAKIVIDRYHFTRQVFWALENVRKDLQKSMSVSLRKYYKRSRSLITKRYASLDAEQKKACDIMLLYNDDLRRAHRLKERFLAIFSQQKFSAKRTAFLDWIEEAHLSGIRHFEKCAATFSNWSHEILNAFRYDFISNGPTEGFNNKIKVLKRVSFGIRRFDRFRKRILLTTN
jgi:transposase